MEIFLVNTSRLCCAEPTAGTVEQENTYSCIFKVTGKV